jgi:hypothetical protein
LLVFRKTLKHLRKLLSLQIQRFSTRTTRRTRVADKKYLSA